MADRRLPTGRRDPGPREEWVGRYDPPKHTRPATPLDIVLNDRVHVSGCIGNPERCRCAWYATHRERYGWPPIDIPDG